MVKAPQSPVTASNNASAVTALPDAKNVTSTPPRSKSTPSRKKAAKKKSPAAKKPKSQPEPAADHPQKPKVRKREKGENKWTYLIEEHLKVPLYPKQAEVIRALSKPNARVALKAANGSGKTTHICAPAVIAFCLMFDDAKVVTTSGVYRQVKEQMWPEIRRLNDQYLPALGGKVNQTELEVAHTRSRAIGFSTDEANKFEGWHAKNLLIIVDEAKGVEDAIFEAVDRCVQGSPDARILMMSSPGGSSGQFWRAFTKETEFWESFTITAFDCPHIKQEEIDKLVARRGEDHPLVRSMVYGEFTDDTGDVFVISESKVNDCQMNPPAWRDKHETVAFLDFAAGGDENVLAHRVGNKVMPLLGWTDRDTVRAVGRFAMELRKVFGGTVPEGHVFGDGSGIGATFCKHLQEIGVPVTAVHNGSKARKPKEYFNRGSEMWGEGAMKVEKNEVILPNDPDLVSQMIGRKWHRQSFLDKVLRVESKEEMKKRGVRSPDRADAVFGCLACGPRVVESKLDVTGRDVLRVMHDAIQELVDGGGRGYDAGW